MAQLALCNEGCNQQFYVTEFKTEDIGRVIDRVRNKH